ncbi:MAG TPA: GNAT family N-acetyltransferase [Terracidiphilus sp.]|nr:GNAT family N-acetyltransferase [Terracidiphilus sp.]
MYVGKGGNFRIATLCPRHHRAKFHCGVAELDAYIQTQAGQDLKRRLAAVNVLTADGETIAGYFTLSASSIFATGLPQEFARKLPRFPLPVTLLGRMAVSEPLQGQGLGDLLLVSALRAALSASGEVASWAVIVDAKAGARSFYLRRSFISMLDPPERLFLPMSVIAKALG